MMTLIFGAALKGTLLLVAAWAATAMLRKSSADLRHKIWLAVLCGLPLLMIPLPVPETARVEVAYTFTAEATGNAAPSSLPIWSMIWAAGAGLLIARFAVGIVQLGRLTYRSEPTNMPGVRSVEIATPLTWGVMKPVILLPRYAADWSGEKCAIAVAHERAHIARGDWFWQSYAQLVTAIFWFHPLVWLASSRLRQEAEEAVDDAVVASGAEATSYAQQLVEVARQMNGSMQVAGVAMVRHPALSMRVAAILDETRIRTLAGVRSRAAIAVVAACSIPVLAAFQSRAPQPVSAPKPRPVERAAPQPKPPTKAPRPVLVAQAAPKPIAPAPSPGSVLRQSQPYKIGDGVSAPVVISSVEPEYSEEAREAKFGGEVWLSVVVDERGFPTDIKVTRKLGLGLDEKAIEAVRMWRFKPAMKDGLAVPVMATLAVSFHLR